MGEGKVEEEGGKEKKERRGEEKGMGKKGCGEIRKLQATFDPQLHFAQYPVVWGINFSWFSMKYLKNIQGYTCTSGSVTQRYCPL